MARERNSSCCSSEKERSAFVAIKRFYFHADKINSLGIYFPQIFVYHERIKVAYGGGRVVIIFIYFVITFSIWARHGAQKSYQLKHLTALVRLWFLCCVFLLHGCTPSATFFIAWQKGLRELFGFPSMLLRSTTAEYELV